MPLTVSFCFTWREVLLVSFLFLPKRPQSRSILLQQVVRSGTFGFNVQFFFCALVFVFQRRWCLCVCFVAVLYRISLFFLTTGALLFLVAAVWCMNSLTWSLCFVAGDRRFRGEIRSYGTGLGWFRILLFCGGIRIRGAW